METSSFLNSIDIVWDTVEKCFQLTSRAFEKAVLGFVLQDGKGAIVCAGSFDVLPGEAQYFIHQLCSKPLANGPHTILLSHGDEVMYHAPFTA